MTKNLTIGQPARLIFVFALPLLLGNVFQQLYGLVDAYMVGQFVGLDAFAAVGCTGGLSFLLIGFAQGMTTGLAIPTAQAFGANRLADVRRSVATGIALTAAVGIVLTVVGLLAAMPLLRLLRTPEEIIGQAHTYLAVTFCGSLAIVFFNYLSAVIRALGDSRTPLVFLAIACILNGVLVVLFIDTFGLGVGGAALATVTAQLISVLLCVWLIRRKMPLLHLHRQDWRITGGDIRRHLRIGMPMGFQSSIIAIGGLTVQFALNALGPLAVAAYAAAQRVDGIAVAPLGSFGLAMATFAAQNYGARMYRRIRVGVSQTLIMSTAFALFIAAVNITCGRTIIAVFVGDAEADVVAQAQDYLIINGALYTVLGLLFVLRNALQGMGHSVAPTLSGSMELTGRVLVALLLAAPFGFVGVCWANPIAWILACVPLTLAWARARRHLIEDERYRALVLAATRLLPVGRSDAFVELTAGGRAGGADVDWTNQREHQADRLYAHNGS